MMKAIGFNKVLIILLLGIFIFLSFLYTFQYLQPDLKVKQRQVAMNNAAISEMTADLDKLTQGLEKFEGEKADFKIVQQLGFFDPQNRLTAKQRITAMKRESRLLSAKYEIRAAVSISNKKLREVGYKILETEITFKLEAIEDADIYKFVYMLNYGFPGQIIINDFSISREKEVTQPLLRKIGVGQAEAIVKAQLNVSWKTMVSDETVSVNVENNQSGEE